MDSTRIPNGFLLPIQIHATHTANSRHANPRGETSHHVVASVTREADNDMMTDLSTIEHLDEPDPTCEGFLPEEVCSRKADMLIASHTSDGWFLCRQCWDAKRDFVGICTAGGTLEERDQHCWIVGELR